MPQLLEKPVIYALDLNTNNPLFDSTDYVWLLFASNPNTQSNVLGYLTLPIQIGTQCQSGPPLNLYTNKQSQCLQTSTNIYNQCSNINTVNSALKLSFFIGQFAIIQVNNNVIYK